MPIDWSTRPSSSIATHRLVKSPSSPAPPNSSGAVRPNSPILPIWCTTSTGKWWARSHSAACGATSASAKSRTLRRKSSCSWESSKLMWVPLSHGVEVVVRRLLTLDGASGRSLGDAELVSLRVAQDDEATAVALPVVLEHRGADPDQSLDLLVAGGARLDVEVH